MHRRIVVSTCEKTGATRTIPINQTAATTLLQKAEMKSLSGYVFFNGAHKKIDRWKLKTQFNRTVKESGIKYFRFHDLRHTFATRLVQAGVDLYKVSKLLGHANISTTQRYAHHYPESLRDGVEVLDNLPCLKKAGEEQQFHVFFTEEGVPGSGITLTH